MWGAALRARTALLGAGRAIIRVVSGVMVSRRGGAGWVGRCACKCLRQLRIPWPRAIDARIAPSSATARACRKWFKKSSSSSSMLITPSGLAAVPVQSTSLPFDGGTRRVSDEDAATLGRARGRGLAFGGADAMAALLVLNRQLQSRGAARLSDVCLSAGCSGVSSPLNTSGIVGKSPCPKMCVWGNENGHD